MFENAVLLGLLSGQSAKHRIGTWKKGSSTDIEVDFIMDTSNDHEKIPIECKAATILKKKHYKNLLHYLRLMNQRFGCCVTAAPLETITTADALTILNLPIYLVTPENIATYSQREAGAAS
ncbi:MAG: hypothetical protein HQ515_24035 [Phycisphaeraceae bacterium]|nr:hypothetical protein [Phycisphaeraceae bacterium]